MPHALLLSPDDQAVNAITGVLEEMSVTCERPLDGVSAAQKLNSQIFDLVLVDCENLPAAKLIFDVCRRGKSGNNAVPVAIVDGRAGLPTAFRLGAELILTKPVAKDQARSTIRAAVSRVRKDVPPSEGAFSQQSSAEMREERAHAAASATGAIDAEHAPRFARGEVPPSYLTAALVASGLATTMQSAVADVADEPEAPIATPSLDPQPSTSPLDLPLTQADSVNAKIARVVKPPSDSELAALAKTESEKPVGAQSALEIASFAVAPAKAEARTRVQTSYRQNRQKKYAPLIAMLMLALAGGGFYLAWTYQPGFRQIAEPQIDRFLEIADKALPPAPSPVHANPSRPVLSLQTAAPLPQPTTNPNQVTSAAPETASSAATSAVAASAPSATIAAPAPAHDAADSPVQPTSTKSVAPAPSVHATKVAVVVGQPDGGKSSDSKPIDKMPGNTRNEIAALPSAVALLPGEDNAIILSSKGAEKRLVHGVPPKYPAQASLTNAAQGTVVLKTVIGEDGDVRGVRLVDGNPVLANTAIQAVKQWHYRPYVRDGKAQPFQTVVIIDFQRP
jgi:protein TonB